MANKLEVIISVDEQGRATSALKGLNQEIEALPIIVARADAAVRGSAAAHTSAAAASKTFAQDLRETQLASKAVGETATTSARLVTESQRTVAKAYQATDKEIETLRTNLRRTETEALKLQRTLSQQGNSAGARTAADISRGAGRGLATIDTDATSFSKVDAASRSARGTLAALKEETKGFNAEVAKSGGLINGLVTNIRGIGTPLTSIISGVLGANLITAATQAVFQLGQNYVEAYQAAKAARAELLRSSVDVGANIRAEMSQVEALKGQYKSLSQAIIDSIHAAAQAASRTPVTQQTILESAKTTDNAATRALRDLPVNALDKSAIDVARQRGIDKAEIAKLLRELEAGNTKQLLGLQDAEVQARFASVINKLPSDFTEEEKILARRNELLRQAQGAYISAGQAAQGYADIIKNLNQNTKALPAISSVPIPSSVADPAQIKRNAHQAFLAIEADTNRFNEAITKADVVRIDQAKLNLEKTDKVRKEFWERAAKDETANAEAARQRTSAQTELVRQARGEADTLFSSLVARTGANNPFVQLFSEGRQAVESFNVTAKSLRQQFGATADDVIGKLEAMTKAKGAALAEDALSQRFSDRLTALSLRQEAAALTGSGQNADTERDARIKDNLLKEGFTPQKMLSALFSQQALKGKLFFDPTAAAASLFSPQKANQETPEIRDARQAVELVRRMQADAAGRGVDRQITERISDEQLLSITGKLSPDALKRDPELMKLRSDTLFRKADQVEGRELEAQKKFADEQKSRAELKASLDKLTRAVERNAGKLDAGGGTLKIELGAGLEAADRLMDSPNATPRYE